MTFAKIADHFRDATTPLAVKDILILSDEGDFTGAGKLQRSGNRLSLDVTLDPDRELPAIGGTRTREQFWKIGGIIEDQVPFWGVSLPDQHGEQQARFTVRSGHFGFDRLHHLTVPFSRGEMRDSILQAATDAPVDTSVSVRGYAFARFADYKLVWRELSTESVEENAFLGKKTKFNRDTLRGALGDFEYGLIQRGADCDLHVRLKEGASAPPGAMARVTRALYRALAFVHGRHTWPQWERLETDDGKLLEYATAPRAVSHNIHTLLTERTCANGSKAELLIERAVACFLRQDDFSEGLDHFLFLAREAAGEDTPAHVGTLGLCAVFEGFASFLHNHFCAAETASDLEFEAVRASLVEHAKDAAKAADVSPGTAASWQRFVGMLRSARPMRPADKFRELSDHLHLPWEKMSPALDTWKKHRHPLAHGAAPPDDFMDQLFARSCIAGAINVLAGAAVGYSGLAVLSRIEERFIKLP